MIHLFWKRKSKKREQNAQSKPKLENEDVSMSIEAITHAIEIIGGLILALGLAGIALSGQRVPSLWLAFAGIVVVLIGVTVGLQPELAKQDAADADREKEKDSAIAAKPPNPEQPTSVPYKFSVRIKTSFVTPAMDRAPMFLTVYKRSDETVMSPMHLAWFIQLTNMDSRNLTVDSFTVEYNMKGVWTALPMIDTRGKSIISPTIKNGNVADFSKCHIFDMSALTFVANMERKNIPSYDTVEGWIFSDEPSAIFSDLRIRMQAASGDESIEPMPAASGDPNSINVQPVEMKIAPGLFDASAIPQINYYTQKPLN
jgi:hypothetical protein